MHNSNKMLIFVYQLIITIKFTEMKAIKINTENFENYLNAMQNFLAENVEYKEVIKNALFNSDVKSEIVKFSTFNLNTKTLMLGEKKLSTKEFKLLSILVDNINTVVSREEALKSIWGDDNYFNARSMDVYICKLRGYLKADPKVQILNIHGEGYKLVVS